MKEKCQEKVQDKLKKIKSKHSEQKRTNSKKDRQMNNAYFSHERMEKNK